MSGIRVIAWRPLRRPPLIGFCKLQYPSGITLAEVAIMRGPRGNMWVGAPTQPVIKDGVAVRDMQSGKIRFTILIDFPNRVVRNQWSNSVIEAYPDFDLTLRRHLKNEQLIIRSI
jgi:hypothetical protein